jgi:hypothetical protein
MQVMTEKKASPALSMLVICLATVACWLTVYAMYTCLARGVLAIWHS